MRAREEIYKIFNTKLRLLLKGMDLDYDRIQEIRLRANKPLIMIYNNEEYFLSPDGKLTKDEKRSLSISINEIKETMEYVSNYSLYAFEEEIRQGFITIKGGHRVGIGGKVVVEDDRIKTIKHISSINIRFAHEVKGCADGVLSYLEDHKSNNIYHTLIISPPRCGKTTLLRDVIRQISNGGRKRKGLSVAVVDERSEICSSYQGIPQNDVGIRTDVLDCCPKAKGMFILIRAMSPSVIAVDEIGSVNEIEAIKYAIRSGCRLIVTVHGDSIDDIKSKPVLKELIKDNIFERYIILSNREKIGHVERILDKDFKLLKGE